MVGSDDRSSDQELMLARMHNDGANKNVQLAFVTNFAPLAQSASRWNGLKSVRKHVADCVNDFLRSTFRHRRELLFFNARWRRRAVNAAAPRRDSCNVT